MSRPNTDLSRWVLPAAVTVAVLMIAQQLAGKAIRDAFFLSVFEPDALPRVMTVASILSVLSVLGVTRLYRSFAPATLVPLFFWLSGALFAAEWLTSRTMPMLAATLVYLHTTSFGAVAISGFWGVISERFDPYTAKRVVGRIAAGATLGGVLGGVAAWQGAGRIAVTSMLLALAATNIVCGLVLLVVSRGAQQRVATTEKREAPWVVFEETPYLIDLALLVGLIALGTAGIDYVFKATAAETYSNKELLVSFFALFYLIVGVVTFVLQSTIASRAIRWLGLQGAVGSLPATLFALGMLSLFVPELFVLALLRGGASTVESSLYRSGYELLYTPLSAAKKRAAKTLIDVGADKLGGAIGAAVAVFIVGLLPESSTVVLLAVSLGCALSAALITGRLARGYVGALAERLADGRIDAAQVAIDDPATRAVVLKTVPRKAEQTDASRPTTEPTEPAEATEPSETTKAAQPTALTTPRAASNAASTVSHPNPFDEHLRTVAKLLDCDPVDIHRALHRVQPIPTPWVAGLVALLDRPQIAKAVADRLAQVAPAHIGLLTDAVLSRRTELEVRRRVVGIMAKVSTVRSAQGLSAALDAEPFEIRYRAAVALSTVTQRNPKLRVDSQAAFAAASTEVARAHTNFFGSGIDASGALTAAGREAGRNVAFCIRVLSLVLPHRPLFDALDALADDDASRRGTGLEYLENVLPADLQSRLLPFFRNRAIAGYARRSDDEILEEISRESDDPTTVLTELIARERRRAEREQPASTGASVASDAPEVA